MRVLICAALLITVLCSSSPLFAEENGDQDAPAWVWKLKDWDLDKDKTNRVAGRFGTPTKWSTGDAICAQDNQGYQFNSSGKIYYVVFFDGELGAGIRVTSLKKYARELGYSQICPSPKLELKKVPLLPLEKIKNFRLPEIMAESEKTILNKLKKPKEHLKDGKVEILSFKWSATKPYHGGEENWQVGTDLKLGFVNGELEYYSVDRFWQN